jgi:DNA polymerase V
MMVVSSRQQGGIGMSARFQIKEIVKQHDVQLFSSNYALYGDLSNRVMKILEHLHQT